MKVKMKSKGQMESHSHPKNLIM